MKVWVLVVVAAAVTSQSEAQFSFPRLPSPPEIIFGAFRPLFAPFFRPRHRLRPRPRPILRPAPQQQAVVFCFQRFRSSQQCRFIRSEIQRPPAPIQVSRPQPPPQVSRPQPASQVSRPQQPFSRPDFRPSPVQFSQPLPQQRPPPDFSNFGTPRPDTLLNPSQSLQQLPPQRPRPQQQQPRPQQQQPRPQLQEPQRFSASQPFPPPLPHPSDNNIRGMTPPPPPPRPTTPRPLPSPPSSPPPPPPSTFQTPGPATARPLQQILPSISNSIDNLLINPVPSVNAGVLPLANEQPAQPQLFPPFTNFA